MIRVVFLLLLLLTGCVEVRDALRLAQPVRGIMSLTNPRA